MSKSPSLKQLADRVLEVPDIAGLSHLLTHSLPRLLEVPEVSFLLWNRKLDTFESLPPGETRMQVIRLGEGAFSTPQARYLISEGALLDTPGGEGEGTLIPLMARSGLVGMLVVGPRPQRCPLPFTPREVRLLSLLANRTALALENQVYQRELINSERMAALGTMAGMLAHDFRGPMTIIRGYAESLADSHLSPEDVHARAATIIETVDRLERMTTETLDFARGGARLARRLVDLQNFLNGLVAGLERELPGLTVVCRFEVPANLSIWVDVDKLRRAISNVAANARDAMQGAGRFHMSAQIEAASKSDRPERLVLWLTDEGPGVPDDIRGSLFEPFVTRGKRHGTGLGLVVARRFVEDHGGAIELLPPQESTSENRLGARFRITIPLLNAPAASGARPTP